MTKQLRASSTVAGLVALSLCVSQTGPARAQLAYDNAVVGVSQPVPAANDWSSGTGEKLAGKTKVERAIGKCAASVIGGALLGALVGAAAGSTKSGALIGTAVGVGVCAIIMKIASKKDKDALRNAQILAANAGDVQQRSWVSSEGAKLNAVVAPSGMVPLVISSTGSYRCRTDNRCLVGDEWMPYESLVKGDNPSVKLASGQAPVLKCRRLSTQVRVEGQMASSGDEAVCLVGDTWITGDKLKKMNIRDEDIVTL